MLGRLFTILSSVSLVLCAAVVLLWMLGYEKGGVGFWRPRTQGYWSADCAQGQIEGVVSDESVDWFGLETIQSFHWEFGGFRYTRHKKASRTNRYERMMSVWCGTMMLLTLILPTAWAIATAHRMSSRRFPATKCFNCGYDLRATPNRCPECGMVPVR